MGWLIALGILALIAIIPAGACVIYNKDGLILSLLLGLIKIRLLPKKKTKDRPAETKNSKNKKSKRKKSSSEVKKQKESKKKNKTGGKITDFIPLIKLAFRFLGSFRRKLRIHRLELKYTMAGGDPCDMAMNYGKAWGAVGNITPYLDRMFVIRKRDIQVQCDFAETSPSIYARLDISITIGRLLGIVLKYGVLALIEFLKIMNKRKGGASK